MLLAEAGGREVWKRRKRAGEMEAVNQRVKSFHSRGKWTLVICSTANTITF
jgi:putative intracellular protease/amidase